MICIFCSLYLIKYTYSLFSIQAVFVVFVVLFELDVSPFCPDVETASNGGVFGIPVSPLIPLDDDDDDVGNDCDFICCVLVLVLIS